MDGEVVDQTGMLTRFTYDGANGSPVDEVVDDDRPDNPNTPVNEAATGKKLKTTFHYDAQGDEREIFDPNGSRFVVTHDSGRRIRQVQGPSNLLTQEWDYDPQGRVTEERMATGNAAEPWARTQTIYSETGKPINVTDPLGRVTTTDYDALDRPIRVTAPWEAGKTRVSEVIYDKAGRKYKERSAVGTDLVQDSATYSYYDDDAVRTITDPRGHALSHAYDGFGRLSILSYADGASESYAYDASDNRTGFTQRDGTVSTTSYDALNRPISITRPGLPVTAYGLDILGRVVAEKAGAVTVRTHVYDSAGRKQSASITLPRPATGATGAAGPTVAMNFTYDANGNRTGATWSGGTVGWSYDGLNRVTGVDFGAEAVTRHVYDLLGRRTATTRGSASSAYGYDIAGQLKSLNHAWSGGSLAASYAYDDAGGLINEALDNNAFLWQPPATLAKTIAYDPASPINALTKVDGVPQTHDARGNRTGAAGRTWRYDTRNMLVGANAPGMAATYGYYPEGGRAWKQCERCHNAVSGTGRDRVGSLRTQRQSQGTHHPRLGQWRCRGGHPQPHRRPDPPAAQPAGQRHRLAAPRW